MKIGIEFDPANEKSFVRWGKDMFIRLKECGFDCIDYGMCNTDTWLFNLPIEEAEEGILEHKRMADEAGITISQVHGPWNPVYDLTPEGRAERMEKMQKSIRLTSLLGCKNWVIHPIIPVDWRDKTVGGTEKTWDINVQFMTELLKTAKEYDVTICLENLPFTEFSIARPEETLKLINTINDDHFKMCLDTGHILAFEDLNLAEVVKEFGHIIKVFHIHDNRRGEGDLHLFPYMGHIDWESFVKSVKEINFTGAFSLETVPSPKLSDKTFEEMTVALANIAKEILRGQ